MSGLGKTRLASLMRDQGEWFHYSIDYRIGTRYMGEHIVDNFKREAMRCRSCAIFCLSDSIYIGSNITFNNLAPLSTYLGKPGDPAKGGLPFEEYMRRQDQHRGPRSTRCWIRPFHRAGEATLRLSPFGLRYRRVDLRGGGPRRPRRSGADAALSEHACCWSGSRAPRRIPKS
jgi:hypothetical protein